MKKSRHFFHIFFLSLLCVLTFLDQWTKYLAKTRLEGHKDLILIPGVFQLRYLENRGAAFGIMQDQRWFFLVMFLVILFAAGYAYTKMPKTSYYLPLFLSGALITAGGIGNSIDRFFRGYVVDFFYFSLIDFPIFNAADIYLVAGTILVIILILFHYKEEDFEFFKSKHNKG